MVRFGDVGRLVGRSILLLLFWIHFSRAFAQHKIHKYFLGLHFFADLGFFPLKFFVSLVTQWFEHKNWFTVTCKWCVNFNHVKKFRLIKSWIRCISTNQCQNRFEVRLIDDDGIFRFVSPMVIHSRSHFMILTNISTSTRFCAG